MYNDIGLWLFVIGIIMIIIGIIVHAVYTGNNYIGWILLGIGFLLIIIGLVMWLIFDPNEHRISFFHHKKACPTYQPPDDVYSYYEICDDSPSCVKPCRLTDCQLPTSLTNGLEEPQSLTKISHSAVSNLDFF